MATPASLIDVQGLAADLSSTLGGRSDFGPGARALYATEASNYRQVPLGVVWPRDVEEVIAAVAACRRHDVPLLSRGAGTAWPVRALTRQSYWTSRATCTGSWRSIPSGAPSASSRGACSIVYAMPPVSTA